MQTQIKTVRSENKSNRPTKVSEAAEELQFLMNFNGSITQAVAKAMEHLTDFVFITMLNLTLARRDTYRNHVRDAIKPDTLAALRTDPLQIATLFQDTVIKQAEEEIAHYDCKGQSASSLSRVKVSTTLMTEVIRGRRVGQMLNRIDLPGRISEEGSSRKARERSVIIPHDQPRAQQSYK